MTEMWWKSLARSVSGKAKSVPVNEFNPLPVRPTLVEPVSATGNLDAAGKYVYLALPNGVSGVVAQVTGVFSGTITFEGSLDGGTYATFTTATAAGVVSLPTIGRHVRVRMSAYTSGAAFVTLLASAGGATGSLLSPAGRVPIVGGGSMGATGMSAPTSFLDAADAARPLGVVSYLFNNTNYDSERQTIAVVSLASAARTTTQTGSDITTYNARYMKVILSTTTIGTGNITVTIQGKAATTSPGTIYYTLLAGAAVGTDTTNVYEVGPGLPVTANVSANVALPRTVRLVVTANNANSAIYSLDYDLSV